MKRLTLFFLILLCCHFSFSQIVIKQGKDNQLDTFKVSPHKYSVKAILKKTDTTSFNNKIYQVYKFQVFNDTTVPICIAFGFAGFTISENSIFPFCLDTTYSDTLHYVNLLVFDGICGWNVEAHPVAPVVVFPNSYLSTNIAVKQMTDGKRIRLSIPYQDKDINFEAIEEYNQGKRRFLHIPYVELNYKTILLPNN